MYWFQLSLQIMSSHKQVLMNLQGKDGIVYTGFLTCITKRETVSIIVTFFLSVRLEISHRFELPFNIELIELHFKLESSNFYFVHASCIIFEISHTNICTTHYPCMQFIYQIHIS